MAWPHVSTSIRRVLSRWEKILETSLQEPVKLSYMSNIHMYVHTVEHYLP